MRSRVPVTLALLTILLASPAAAQTQFEWRAGERPVRELRTDRLDRLDAARDRMTRRMSRAADRVRSRVIARSIACTIASSGARRAWPTGCTIGGIGTTTGCICTGTDRLNVDAGGLETEPPASATRRFQGRFRRTLPA